MMAHNLCMVTMDLHATTSKSIVTKSMKTRSDPGSNVNMQLLGLGDGKLISFVRDRAGLSSGSGWSIHSWKEVSLTTQGVHLIPFQQRSLISPGSCVLATGNRPIIVYLTGNNAGGNINPKLNYSLWVSSFGQIILMLAAIFLGWLLVDSQCSKVLGMRKIKIIK
jgi:hypothetical protein